jgi:predicted enzyme related to lactoylglutathione lyase
MDMGPMGTYEFLRHGALIGAVMTKMPDMPVSAWAFYFRVDDIDKAVAQVKAGGGTVYNGPQEVPGGDYVINGIDPQGAHFALVGAKR